MNIIPQSCTFWSRVLLGICFMALVLVALSPELARSETTLSKIVQDTKTPADTTDTTDTDTEVSQLIKMLEDDKSRQEVIKLLKLMVVLEDDKKGKIKATETSESKIHTAFVDWLHLTIKDTYQNLLRSSSDLKLALGDIKKIGTALNQPPAVEMWRNYLLQLLLGGMVCLFAILFVTKKLGPLPSINPDWSLWLNLVAITKYFFIIITPNLLLILTFWVIPAPSNTAVGVTADMATGFSLIQSLCSYFFIDLSILYIFLQAVGILFTVSPNGRAIVNIHPVLARYILRSSRNIAIYIYFCIFLRVIFLDYFATDPLYSFCLGLLILPIPIYLSKRLLRLRHLVHQIKEAEITAGDLETTTTDSEGTIITKLEYHTDIFLKKHWVLVTSACIWMLGLISIFNPANLADSFSSHIFFSLGIVSLAWLIIVAERKLALRLLSPETEQGRKFLLHIDSLFNVFIWLGMVLSILTIWGLPLKSIFSDALVQNILGRMVAITITVVGLIIFLKFSNMITEWLLSSPDRSENRNWRTMTPLVLTAVRALAIFAGIVVVLERLGVNVGPILAGAGILGLGIGMGAQSLVKDVINGISMLMADTLSVGDYVTIGGLSGTVESVGLRNIRLRDNSNNLIIVPNSSVDSIINMTRDSSQDLVEFTAPYDADPDKMMALGREVAHELSTDSEWLPLLIKDISMVGVVSFDSNGTTIRLRVHSYPGQQWAVGRELRLRLKRRMLQDGLKSPWFGQNIFLFEGDKNYDAPKDPKERKEDKVKDVDRL